MVTFLSLGERPMSDGLEPRPVAAIPNLEGAVLLQWQFGAFPVRRRARIRPRRSAR